MPNFLDRLKQGFGKQSSFAGEGKSLGGSSPGRIFAVELAMPGSLGIQVEKTARNTAIVSHIVPGSQADQAGMKRGDIILQNNNDNPQEMMYDAFLQQAKSQSRPLSLRIRRLETLTTNDRTSFATATAVTTTTTSSASQQGSADAEARRKAVIQAAEARDKAHKERIKPISKKKDSSISTSNHSSNAPKPMPSVEPQSDLAIQAAQQAKENEAKLAQQLGYNPFEASRATAGQARNAKTTSKHGSLGGEKALPTVAPPRDPVAPVEDDHDPPQASHEFLIALETLVTSNEHDKVIQSLTILLKLISNANTKDDDKFRRIRLSNAKIKEAIVDVEGAFDVMTSVGFVLVEEDGESWLVLPAKAPPGVAGAVHHLQHYLASQG